MKIDFSRPGKLEADNAFVESRSNGTLTAVSA